jgi:hypothetical protein
MSIKRLNRRVGQEKRNKGGMFTREFPLNCQLTLHNFYITFVTSFISEIRNFNVDVKL